MLSSPPAERIERAEDTLPAAEPIQPPPTTAGALYRRWRSTPARGESLALARVRRLRQGGRAALLWVLIFYAAAQAVVFVIMDRWHPILTQRTYRAKRRQLRQRVARAQGRPLFVMIGSSRTEQALQAWRFDGMRTPDGRSLWAYNYGIPAAGPMHELLFVREMLDAGIRPRLLLVEFLPPLLNEPQAGITSEEEWTRAHWLSVSQFRRLRPYFSHPGRKTVRWLESRLAPCYAYREELHAQLQEYLFPGTTQRLNCPHDGGGWLIPLTFTPGECLSRLEVARNMYEKGLRQFRLARGTCQAMRDLLALCRQEQIPVALVLMPEATVFRSWYNPRGLADALGLLDELRTTYGVEVIDAGFWVPDWEFIDGHHVQGVGADRFSIRVRAEVERLLARTADPPGDSGPGTRLSRGR